MGANEDFEAFAERFNKKYHFLPLGKDDPCRPSAEYILGHLGQTFCELERAELAATVPPVGAANSRYATALENLLYEKCHGILLDASKIEALREDIQRLNAEHFA